MKSQVGTDPRGEGQLREDVARASLQRALFGRAQPVQLGRYEVRGRVGSGGMGVVYRGFDPRLSRQVAIKVIKPDDGAPADGVAQARLLREARALAALSHPHIVAVFDSGVAEGIDPGTRETYVVTELVEGASADIWLRDGNRSVAEIRRVFAQAGRGLIAAHDAGLVHRDFKLGNVLVGADGRARVCDFGLVVPRPRGDDRTTLELERGTASGSSSGAGIGREASALWSEAGRVAGTAGYIAPELLGGAQPSVASDQFAFCVALYRALYRRHPDEPGDTENDPVLPASLRSAIARGLSDDPGQRWETLGALVEIVDPARARRVSRTAMLGAVGVALVGIAISARPDQAHECDAQQHLSPVWNDTKRDAIGSRVGAQGDEGLAQAVLGGLDEYAAAWSDGYGQACQQVAAAKGAGVAAADRRITCLQDRLREFDALVVALPSTDAGALPYLRAATLHLRPVTSCSADAGQWLSPSEEDSELARRSQALLAVARAAVAVHLDADAEPILRQALETSAALVGAPVYTDIRTTLGEVVGRAGDLGAAAELLESTYFEVLAEQHTDEANRVAIARLEIAVDAQALEDGRQWARHARSTLDERWQRSHRRVRLERALGLLEIRDGDVQVGSQHVALALALALEASEPDVEQVSASRRAVAEALMAQGRYAEAHAQALQARDAAAALLGAGHPLTLSSRVTAATLLVRLGRADEAREELLEAVRLSESTYGARSLEVADAIANLASTEMNLENIDAAYDNFTRALELRSAILGPEHPRVLFVQRQLAIIAAERLHLDEACRRFQSIIDVTVRRQGPDHRDLANLQYHLALGHNQAGRNERANVAAREALRILELHFGAQHVNVVHPLRLLAVTDPDPAAALEHARRAVAMVESTESPPERESGVYAALGYALERAGHSADSVDAAVLRAMRTCNDGDCRGLISRLHPERYQAMKPALARAP